MPIAAAYTNPTGKRNLMASFKKWLTVEAPTAGAADFVYDFVSDVSNPQTLSSVSVKELQYFDPANVAFGMNVFPASTYPVATPAKHGTLSAVLMEIEIQTDQGENNDALQRVYKIRDRIKAALMQAGVPNDETGVVAVAPIEVKDFENAEALTGILARVPTEQDTAIQEFYIAPDEATPNIHTIRLLVRLEWFELN